MIADKNGELKESSDYRLPKLIVDKGLKLLEKNPSLQKQFEMVSIAGRTDMAFMKVKKKAGRAKNRRRT
jgi:hypothetical protein